MTRTHLYRVFSVLIVPLYALSMRHSHCARSVWGQLQVSNSIYNCVSDLNSIKILYATSTTVHVRSNLTRLTTVSVTADAPPVPVARGESARARAAGGGGRGAENAHPSLPRRVCIARRTGDTRDARCAAALELGLADRLRAERRGEVELQVAPWRGERRRADAPTLSKLSRERGGRPGRALVSTWP